MKRVLTILLLAAAFLSAAAQNYTKREVMIPMRDGVSLYTAIYEPVDAVSKRPIIMRRTPYGCKPYGNELTKDLEKDFKYFAEHQYIIVLQDVRGKNKSQGHFVQVRPYNENASHGPVDGNLEIDESTDSYDTIEWLVNNTATNGNAGVLGVSYPGFYATMAALSNHPALKAASPQAPVTDWFVGDDVHHNGAFMMMDLYSFGRTFFLDREANRENPYKPQARAEGNLYEYFLNQGSTFNTLLSLADEQTLREKYDFWEDVIDHPDYDEYWYKANPSHYFKDIKPAVMVVGGSYDGEDCYGAIKTWQEIRRRSPDTELYFVYGPWPHGYWRRAKYEKWGDAAFGPGLTDWYMEKVEYAFFRRYLEDDGQVEKLPAVTIVPSFWDNSRNWETVAGDDWPTFRTRPLYLAAGRKLSWDKPRQFFSSDKYVSDPSSPVPYTKIEKMGGRKEYVIEGQEFVEDRADVLTYSSEPVEHTLFLAGPVKADLWFSTTAKDLDFVVKLIDVDPEGRQMMIRGEVFRARYSGEMGRTDGTHRFIKPGRIVNLQFDMPDVAHYLIKGHSMKVQIQSSWFPLVDMNPQTAVDNIYRAKPEDYEAAEITIFHERNHPSCLQLPVAESSYNEMWPELPDFSHLTSQNHPRLLLDDEEFETLRLRIAEDRTGTLKMLNDLAIGIADKSAFNDIPIEHKYDATNLRILNSSRYALRRIWNCSYAYRMTGESKYLEKAEEDILTVCSFPDWNAHKHFLDAGEMSAAVGLAYDWLYHDLKPETKSLMVRKLKEYAFDPAADDDVNQFYNMLHNWNQVCNGGLVTAALATYEECDTTARRLVTDAMRTNRITMEHCYSPDGNYAEGPAYWNYGTLYQALLLKVLKDALGTDLGLGGTEGFDKTARYMLYVYGANGRFFNYSDNSESSSPSYPLWYFADKLNDPSLLYNELRLLREGEFGKTDSDRMLPLVLSFAYKFDFNDVPLPDGHVFFGRGKTPVVMVRGDWSATETDRFLGIKGGTPSSNHSHMDGGEIVYDAYGVRWFKDMGPQSYQTVENAISAKGGDFWSMQQGSLRWKLFRMNNRQHSTITINDTDHRTTGRAELVDVIDAADGRGATFDLTTLFGDQAANVTRTAVLVDDSYLRIEDSVTAHEARDARVRVTFVTPAEVELRDDCIVLRRDGRMLTLKTEGSGVAYRQWPADPKAYDSPLRQYDIPDPEARLCGFEAVVPAGEKAVFVTSVR